MAPGLAEREHRPAPVTADRPPAALEEVGLAGRADAWPNTLSGGEGARVALARALVRQPELLLLDEPFAALDAFTRIKMHALVRQLWERHHPAVIMVTHDVDEAMMLADRVVVMKDGNHRARRHGRHPASAPAGRPSARGAARPPPRRARRGRHGLSTAAKISSTPLTAGSGPGTIDNVDRFNQQLLDRVQMQGQQPGGSR